MPDLSPLQWLQLVLTASIPLVIAGLVVLRERGVFGLKAMVALSLAALFTGGILSTNLQSIDNQQWSRLSLLSITPMVIATGVLLWHKRALGTRGLLAATAVSLFISWFLLTNV